jgi:hypothetical protein
MGDKVMRTFETGATRDEDKDKLDYVKALSPIVLKRYVQFLREHRRQADGTFRDYDNWKKGIPIDVYHASLMRHQMELWLTLDGQGAGDRMDLLCAILFNSMGMLHEMLLSCDKEDLK